MVLGALGLYFNYKRKALPLIFSSFFGALLCCQNTLFSLSSLFFSIKFFKVFGYCDVVSLLGFIIHQSFEDTFVSALILWLEE